VPRRSDSEIEPPLTREPFGLHAAYVLDICVHKKHVMSGACQIRADAAADGAGTDDQEPHRILQSFARNRSMLLDAAARQYRPCRFHPIPAPPKGGAELIGNNAGAIGNDSDDCARSFGLRALAQIDDHGIFREPQKRGIRVSGGSGIHDRAVRHRTAKHRRQDAPATIRARGIIHHERCGH